MMLRALYDLAQRQGLLESPDYEKKKVDLFLRIDADGRFLSLESAGEKVGRGPAIDVPRLPIRTQAVKAGLLFDNAKYVLGVSSEEAKAERLALCVAAFREELAPLLVQTEDPAVLAVGRFLDRLSEQREAILSRYPFGAASDWTGSENIAFRYDPDESLVHQRESVRRYFAAQRAQSAAQGVETRCLVTGEWTVPTRLHPAVKRIPQAQTSGAMLVSFNSDAFLSQGTVEDTNAPVSRAAAEGYVTALNWLLESTPSRRFRYGVQLGDETVMVFWTKDPHQIVDEVAAELTGGVDVKTDEQRALQSVVSSVGDALWSGKRLGTPDETDTAFYAAVLSGHARVIVRDWIETTAQTVRNNLRQFQSDLSLGSASGPSVPLPLLLSSLETKSRALPPQLLPKMIRAAFQNQPLPRQVLSAALDRIRLPADSYDSIQLQRRCAIVKAYLRRCPTRVSSSEVTVSLDENNRDVPYLLGRLFAVLEHLQDEAMKRDINSTIRDRYFGAASSTPGLTFPRLIKLSVHHAAKAERYDLEKLMSSIMAALPPVAFPRMLGLEEQGLFAIGYYHQRDKRFEKRASAAAPSSSSSEDPS